MSTDETFGSPDPTELYSAGLLAQQKGNRDLAQALLERSAALLPHFKTFERLGTLAFESRNWEQAAAYYRQSVDTDPKQARPHFFLAQAYIELGQMSLAADSAATAVRLNPQYVRAAELLASIAGRREP